MKKFSYLLVFIFSLFFVNNVKAISNIGTFSDLTIADIGLFSSINGQDVVSNRGYSLIKNVDFYYALPSTPNFHYGTYGGSLTQCGLAFATNTYFSMTYYFILNDKSNYLHPYYTKQSPRMGISTNPSNVFFNFDYESVSSSVDILTLPEPTIFGEYLGLFTVVFKAPTSGTCLSMAYSSSSKNAYANEVVYVGYKYNSLGSKPLSSSDIQNALSQNFTNIENKINDMKTEQQETNDKLDKTNQELGEMNDFLQDDTPARTDDIDMDSLGTVSGLLPVGPVDSLLNIPFTFLSVLTSSMGGVCVPITGTFVFDSTLSIPCFDSFYDDVPGYLMNFINLIPAGFILIMYFKHLYKKVDRAVSLQTTTDDEWGVI